MMSLFDVLAFLSGTKEVLGMCRLCFLGLLAESPDDMQQTVGRDDVVECLRASLSVDVSSDVGEIAQDVESVEEEGEVALGYAFR